MKAAGQIVIVSVFDSAPRVDLHTINFKEQEIVGSRVYTRNDFQTALSILKEDNSLEKLITQTYPLEDIQKVFRKDGRGGQS